MFKLAVLLATVASAVASPSCNAQRFSGGVYYSFSVEAGFGSVAVSPGQTITASLVDLKTCAPFAPNSFPSTQLTKFSATVLDVDSNYDDFPNSVNATSVVGNKIVAYAGVPNGSPHLSFSAGVEFVPGGLDNWNLVTKNVGILYTIA